ncbi:hypothetical protein HELRODRAFT_164977 [Helobdella robusta]|uniref:Uncharacterized protein n=1 Tax=Helobdella robusta TaxID=6412 RepID=T1EW20_HELRO|nr:hypothetical protein HELRODRAFT_164977 [Helobdella robusta]ESN92847.1 hypothetical protein HELRODRAFT_164977 [Helobdella robusta]
MATLERKQMVLTTYMAVFAMENGMKMTTASLSLLKAIRQHAQLHIVKYKECLNDMIWKIHRSWATKQNAEQNATIPSANLHMNDSLLPVLSLHSLVQQQQDHHRNRKAEHSSSSSHTSHSRNRLQLDRRLHERPEQNLNQQQKRQPRFQQQRHHQHLMKQDKCQPNYQQQKQHHYEKQVKRQPYQYQQPHLQRRVEKSNSTQKTNIFPFEWLRLLRGNIMKMKYLQQ